VNARWPRCPNGTRGGRVLLLVSSNEYRDGVRDICGVSRASHLPATRPHNPHRFDLSFFFRR
jgi:hypothetical protein